MANIVSREEASNTQQARQAQSFAKSNWAGSPQPLPQEIPNGLQYIRRDRAPESFVFGFGTQYRYSKYTQSSTGSPIFASASLPDSLNIYKTVDPYCNSVILSCTGVNSASQNNIIYVRLFLRQNPSSIFSDDVIIPFFVAGTLEIPVACNVYGVAVHSKNGSNDFNESDFTVVTGVQLT